MYKSPLHILSGLDEQGSPTDPGYLLRVRKRLLAEFDLGNAVTIRIGTHDYSKDEIIKAIDTLMGDPRMPMHSFVFANKPLLDFLENDASKTRIDDLRGLSIPEEIHHPFSAVLTERLSHTMRKCFYARDFERASTLLHLVPKLTETDAGEFNEEINRGIRNLENHVRAVQSTQLAESPKELMYLRRIPLADFLNHLPESHLDAINSFAAAVINMMVTYQKLGNHDRSFLYYVSNMLCRLRCDDEIRRLIHSNHAVFMQNHERTSDSVSAPTGSGSVSAGRMVYIALVVVIFLVRILVTCNRSTTTSYNVMDSINAMNRLQQREQSDHDAFNDYRNFIIGYKDRNASEFPTATGLIQDSSLSGKNPFRVIYKSDAPYEDYADTSLRRVIINNTTNYDVIITAIDGVNAKSYFFFRNHPDTLSFRFDDNICLYFGDSLSNSAFGQDIPDMIRFMKEVRFRHVDALGYKTLENNYTIGFKPGVLKKLKKKKKAALPVIKLDAGFFDNNGYEDSKVKLSFFPIKEEVPPEIVQP